MTYENWSYKSKSHTCVTREFIKNVNIFFYYSGLYRDFECYRHGV